MGIAKIPPSPRHCTNAGTCRRRSMSSSKEPARSRSPAKRDPSLRGLRSLYLAAARTPARTRGRRKCGSLTFLLRTRLRRSSTSSRIEPGRLPGRTTGEILEKLLAGELYRICCQGTLPEMRSSTSNHTGCLRLLAVECERSARHQPRVANQRAASHAIAGGTTWPPSNSR